MFNFRLTCLLVFLFSVALARSKSTPGLVESTGKVPLDHMLVSRHHTLPTGLISGGSDRRNEERKAVASQSEDNLVAHAPFHEEPEPTQQVVCNMTTSMTISSLTSGISGSPPIRSPVCTESQKSTFSPPLSPRQVTCSPIGGISTISASALPVMSNSFQQPLTQLPPNYNPMIQQFPYAMGPHPMTYLSPFCASPGIMPQTPTSTLLITPQQTNLGASQSNLAPPHIQHPSGALIQSSMPNSPLAPSGGSPISFGSPSRDSQSDILLKEISRLRERLAQVETENTALTVKLNQQQWDVENRLTELELHICQSDSVTSTGSGDERTERPSVNRESII